MQSSENLTQQASESSHENVVNFPVKPQDECIVNSYENAPLPVKLAKNREIANHFGVKIRTIQNWSVAIRDAGVQLERDAEGYLLPSSILEYQQVRDLGISEYLAAHGAKDATSKAISASLPQQPTEIVDVELDFAGLVRYQAPAPLTPYSIDAFAPIDLGSDRAELAIRELADTRKSLEESELKTQQLLKQLAIARFNNSVSSNFGREQQLAEIYQKAKIQRLEEIQVAEKARKDADVMAKKLEEAMQQSLS